MCKERSLQTSAQRLTSDTPAAPSIQTGDSNRSALETGDRNMTKMRWIKEMADTCICGQEEEHEL